MSLTSAKLYTYPARVYYEDTDLSGLVYHANYLKFCERARTQAMLDERIDLNRLYQLSGWHFVVRSLQTQFHRPAQFLDALSVVSQIQPKQKTQIVWFQRIMNPTQDMTYVTLEAQLVLIDQRMRPKRMPSFDALRDLIAASDQDASHE
jgi:acyl-CoA thioester hydrolase